MALKLRKDIKKSSYYVWFLGAKESKGLRGNEYILPVIKHLEQRERDIEPFKVTLQVSHKGLKIIQNIPTNIATTTTTTTTTTKSKAKNEIIKHFIPHNTITCCYQQDDIIACILLLFNPVTKCPLHIHAYRCDSLETATVLKQQLQTLIDRPDNQKKFAEIESRLKTTLVQPTPPPPGGRLKNRQESCHMGSDRSTRESESSEERYPIETNRNVTTLYDSVAAELREKLRKNNVPILLPPRDYDTVHRQKGNLTGIELRRCLNSNIVGHNVINNNNNNNNNNNHKGSKRLESSGGSSGIGSDHPPSPDTPESPDTRYNTMDNHSTSDEDWNGDPSESALYLMHNGLPLGAPTVSVAAQSQMTLPRPGQSRDKSPELGGRYQRIKPPPQQYHRELTRYLEQPISKFADKKFMDRQKSLEIRRSTRYYDDDDDVYDEDDEDIDEVIDYRDKSRKYADKEKPIKYFDDDGFDENLRYRSKSSDFMPRYHYDCYDNDKPVPRQRQKYQYRQRSPSPPPPPVHDDNNDTSPRDRFKDAKEKFLQMEQQRYHQHNNELPIAPVTKDKPFLKRHESVGGYEKNRPKPAPRNFNQSPPPPSAAHHEDVRYRDSYQKYDKYEPKRRSMFSLIEEEHRKNSSEIAKELKRRTYFDNESHSKSTVDLDYVGNSGGYRHSYVEPKSRNGNKSKNFGEMLHRTNSISNTSGRVGLASVHPY